MVRLDSGAVVLVAGALPGETVELEGRDKQARLLRVVEASADRVEPPCPHAIRCGGCDLMHLGAIAQMREHARLVADLLAHALPGRRLPEVVSHPAPAALRYRTRARFFVRARGGAAQVGYRASASHDIEAVADCLVLAPEIEPMLGDLTDVLAGSRGDGDAQVALGQSALPVVEIVFRGELAQATWARVDARVRDGLWAGARVRLDGVARPASFGDPGPVLVGADGAPLRIAAGGFAQPSDASAAVLARRVAELAREGFASPPHVVELFAGSGTLSILLARDTASFTAVEIDLDATVACRDNLAARELVAKVVAADADAYVVPARAEVVVLDPPRAGAPGASRAIVAARPKAIVYVACDPPTLARDLATLAAGGFEPTHVEAFELFPQTSHVETVVRLVRRPPPR